MKRLLILICMFSFAGIFPQHCEAKQEKTLTVQQKKSVLRVIRAYRDFSFVLREGLNRREYSQAYLDLRKKIAPFMGSVPESKTKVHLNKTLSCYQDARDMWESYVQPNGQAYSVFYMMNSHILSRYFKNLQKPKPELDTPINFEIVLDAVWKTADYNTEVAAASI